MGTFHPLVAQSTVQCPESSQLSTIMYKVAVALLLVGLSMTNAAFMGGYGGSLGYGAGVGAMGVGAIAAPVAVGGVGHSSGYPSRPKSRHPSRHSSRPFSRHPNGH